MTETAPRQTIESQSRTEGESVFLAWRELRFARGRFLLVAVIVVLMTVLVGFISGLTRGLANENTAAIAALGADRVVFSDSDDGPSYAESSVSSDQANRWTHADGVTSVEPVGITTTHARGQDGDETVAVFGAGSGLHVDGMKSVPTQPGTAILSEPAAEALNVSAGESIDIAGSSFEVTSVAGDGRYAHRPVVWVPISSWRDRIAASPAYSTVLAVSAETGSLGDDPDGTVSMSVSDSFAAIGSYESENGSLTMMTVMLYVISALVVGAFFIVWTLQRAGDLAVLKALGASTASLIREILGQALIVVGLGVTVGIAITVVAGLLIGDALPFVLDASTTVVPGLTMTALGLTGAAASVRVVTSSDPLHALNRAA